MAITIAENKDNQKLYMKWWFWVIAAILFIFTISVFIPNSDCEELENNLIDCEERLSDLLDALDGYDEALEDYCKIDYTNPLCDALIPGN